MQNIIEPRVLKGFRDTLPEGEILRKNTIRKLEDVFKSFGFDPIDTPILEYSEILLGKGGGETEKQIYRFNDNGKRDVAMRFDLTVPFSRFMAAHYNELYLPFKRYQIDKVWRGENTQKGRYREFYQCDFDIVGSDSVLTDLEIILLILSSFEALGIEDISINISDRAVFNAFLEKENLLDSSVDILRCVDKLAKIGEEKVLELLSDICSKEKAAKILDFIKPQESFKLTLEKLKGFSGEDNLAILRLEEIYSYLSDLNLSDKVFLNPSITRGLDYYTGIVYETFLNAMPQIGSVCSGGRYSNLVSLYSKQKIEGVGASIGLDRLLAALSELSEDSPVKSETHLSIFSVNQEFNSEYFKLAKKFREENINCEVIFKSSKLQKQFNYAEKKGIRFALICGEDEFESKKVSLKDLSNRESYNMIDFSEAVDIIKNTGLKDSNI